MKKIVFSILILVSLSCDSEGGQKTNVEVSNDTIELKTVYKDTTIIYPHLNGLIQQNQNSIYCASFEIAWNKIRDQILNEPIILEKKIDWVEYLNNQETNNSIDSKFLVSYAGFGKDQIIEKINKSLKNKFNRSINHEVEIDSNELFTYAFFQKNLEFKSKLEDYFYNTLMTFNDGDTINFFGLQFGNEGLKNEDDIVIYDYINRDDFIIQIRTNNTKEEIYLAKVKPDSTLIENL
jgi:hypothetical protein